MFTRVCHKVVIPIFANKIWSDHAKCSSAECVDQSLQVSFPFGFVRRKKTSNWNPKPSFAFLQVHSCCLRMESCHLLLHLNSQREAILHHLQPSQQNHQCLSFLLDLKSQRDQQSLCETTRWPCRKASWCAIICCIQTALIVLQSHKGWFRKVAPLTLIRYACAHLHTLTSLAYLSQGLLANLVNCMSSCTIEIALTTNVSRPISHTTPWNFRYFCQYL